MGLVGPVHEVVATAHTLGGVFGRLVVRTRVGFHSLSGQQREWARPAGVSQPAHVSVGVESHSREYPQIQFSAKWRSMAIEVASEYSSSVRAAYAFPKAGKSSSMGPGRSLSAVTVRATLRDDFLECQSGWRLNGRGGSAEAG